MLAAQGQLEPARHVSRPDLVLVGGGEATGASRLLAAHRVGRRLAAGGPVVGGAGRGRRPVLVVEIVIGAHDPDVRAEDVVGEGILGVGVEVLALLVGDVTVAVREEGGLGDVGHRVTGEVDGGQLEDRLDGPRVGEAGVEADCGRRSLAAPGVTHDPDVVEVHGADQGCCRHLPGLRSSGLPRGQRLVQSDGLIGLGVEEAHRPVLVGLLQPAQGVEEFLTAGGRAVVGRQLVVVGVDGVRAD